MNAMRLPRRTTTAHTGRRFRPPPASAPAVPEDLRTWLPESVLVRLVLDAATGPELTQHPLAPLGDGEETFAAGLVLSLLAYSYATGRFGSEEIEASLRSDPTLAYLATRRVPSAAVFRRCRRRHRDLLTVVLTRVLDASLNWRAAVLDALLFVPLPNSAQGSAPDWRACQNAQDRIQRAVLEDAVAADI